MKVVMNYMHIALRRTGYHTLVLDHSHHLTYSCGEKSQLQDKIWEWPWDEVKGISHL